MSYEYNNDIITLDEASEMVNELNELAPIEITSKYLKYFAECIRKGAIKELTIDGTTYELYADIIETEE